MLQFAVSRWRNIIHNVVDFQIHEKIPLRLPHFFGDFRVTAGPVTQSLKLLPINDTLRRFRGGLLNIRNLHLIPVFTQLVKLRALKTFNIWKDAEDGVLLSIKHHAYFDTQWENFTFLS